MLLTENHSPQYYTTSIFDPAGFYKLDQSGSSYDAPYQLAVGKGSLAISPDAALVQKRMMEHAIELLSYQTYKRLVSSPMVMDMFPMYVDIAEFVTTIDRQALIEDRERSQLSVRLQATFEADPLEDGMDHPAERIIAKVLEGAKDQYIYDLFRTFSLDATHPSFAASVLRCLGRHVNPGTASWRTDIVRGALRMNDIEIRDAAVQAAELWGDKDMRGVLEAHSEQESWLRDYIRDVIDDLGE